MSLPDQLPRTVARDPAGADRSLLIGGSAEAFGELINPYRRELLVHCYRMLGSIDDAEEAVQEVLGRAWQGRNTFQRSVSFRAWLYRIATNACLDAIERRKRSMANVESRGVVPVPDDLLREASEGPEARYDSHESISLAFLTVLQVLSPRQRAVLILRDVLSWRAAEVADLLDLTVPAVNSALHRARATVSSRYESPRAAGHGRSLGDPGLGSLLERYVRAWEENDVASLVALLRHDAVVSMPPGLLLVGAGEIGRYLAASVFVDGTRIRLAPIRTNGGLAHVLYSAAGDAPLRSYAVVLAETDGPSVVQISAFAVPRVIARFGLAEQLAG